MIRSEHTCSLGNSALRKLLIVLVAVLFAGVLSISLSGCADSKPYIGTWNASGELTHNDGLTYKDTFVLNINKDGKWTMTMTTQGRWTGLNYGSCTWSGKWEVPGKGGLINLYTSETPIEDVLEGGEFDTFKLYPSEDFKQLSGEFWNIKFTFSKTT